jgi:hypothetical protein
MFILLVPRIVSSVCITTTVMICSAKFILLNPPPAVRMLLSQESTAVDRDFSGGDICEFNMTINPSPETCAAACCADENCQHFVTLAPGHGYVGGGVCSGHVGCPVGGSCCYLKSGATTSIPSMYVKPNVLVLVERHLVFTERWARLFVFALLSR